jgi:peptide deformylase
MKPLKVIELGNPILRAKAKSVSVSEIKSKAFQNFCKKLIAICEAKKGVGIAAPQVGVLKRVFIVWSKPSKRYKHASKMEPLVVINPKLSFPKKNIEKGYEGCLSIPGIRGLVPRYKEVVVEYLNEKGEKKKEKYSEFVAKIFQHEGDHLDGIVFLDRTNPKDLITEAEYQKIVKKKRR